MYRCFEFKLNKPGLEKGRFLVWRQTLAANGDAESDFLAGITDLKRHPAGTGISQAIGSALTAPDTDRLVVVRNPDIVLDPQLPHRVIDALDALPADDVWSLAGSGGLGTAEGRYLSLYATATPALPDLSGPTALLDVMPDLYIVNATFAADLVQTWRHVPDAALEPVLAVEGYLAGRVAFFAPRLTAGINGDLVSRDLGKLSDEVADHFGHRFPHQTISTLSGAVRTSPPGTPGKFGPPAAASLADTINAALNTHSDSLLVSVVVRTRFDRPHLLDRLLASLSRTRLEGIDLEVILSSDRDLADSAPETERLQADFRTLAIRLQHNIPQGHSRVDNLIGGIRAARGDYVMIIDDDDYVDLLAFEMLGKALFLGHRPLIVTGSEVHEERWEETPSGRWVLTQSAPKSRYPSNGWREMFGGVNKLPICALLIPRERLQKRISAFSFKHDLSEDYALFLLLLTDPKLPGIVEIPDVVCHISVRGQENSVSMPDRRPWVRDITGYLTDLTSNQAVAGPGLWALLGANARRADDQIEARSLGDMRQALDRAEANIALLRRENDRLRRAQSVSGEPVT